MLLITLSYLSAIIGLLVISFFVWQNNRSLIGNKLFVLLNLNVAAWLLLLLLSDLSQQENLAILFFRSALVAGQFMFYVFFIFSLVFPFTITSGIKRLAIITAIPTVIISLLLLTPLGLQSLVIDDNGVRSLVVGSLYSLSDIVGIIYMIAGIIIIVSKYKKANIQQRSQIVIFNTGLIIGIIANTFANIIFLEDANASLNKFVSGLSILIFSFFIAYAIVRHHLFNIKSVVVRSFAYVVSITATVLIIATVTFFLSNLFLNTGLSFIQLLFFAVVSAIAALFFQNIKEFFNKISNTIFYRDAYDSQQILNIVNAKIVTSTDLHMLLDDIAIYIKDEIKLTTCNFYIDQDAAIDFHIAGTNTTTFNNSSWIQLLDYVGNHNDKIIYLENATNVKDIDKIISDTKVSVIFKMSTQDQIVGYMLLGDRRSGASFYSQDTQVLEIIADELAITVQNAIQLEQISQFANTLQQKIDDATKELQATNEKLRSLDEAKDEFISMASHQLRTPLTSIKGYISMMIDGDVGQMTKQQKDFLNQAFMSSQRMVFLIADLLNVSRLKTGKFVIERNDVYLPKVVEAEIEQLEATAKDRELNLVYKKPSNYPILKLDETKTMQVIMNFIDNAIYYSKKGGDITLELKTDKNYATFTVTDTGIGVPKKEQHHLFTKFYRADNAKKARPDGTGLGLFMAKKVIMAQGGTLIFKSTEGKGSTFGFKFPIS